MTKLFCIIAALAAVCGTAIAGEITLEVASVPTNATAVASGTTTNDGQAFLYGYVDTLILDFSIGGSGSYTCNVDVVTAGFGPERTIFSMDDLTSANDGISYPVRDIVTTTAGVDISNTPAKIPLFQNQLVLRAYAKNVTNTVALSVHVITTPDAAGN